MRTQQQIQPHIHQFPNSRIQLHINKLAYGKPTKNRSQDPSMFELLACQNRSQNHQDFKEIKQDQQIQMKNNSHGNQRNQILKGKNNEFFHYAYDRQNQQRCCCKNIKRVPSPDLENGHRAIQDKKFRPMSPDPYLKNPRKLPYRKNAFGFNQSQQNEVTEEEELKKRQQLIEKFKQTTRWIPNSSFTIYFGKPPFENYGYKNVKPTKGGLVYGTYLYSHNVYPHRGMNSPKSIQSYPVALAKAKSQGTIVPFPPRTKNPDLNRSAEGNDNIKKFSNIDIYPEPNLVGKLEIQIPDLMDIEKFGGKGISRKTTNNHYFDVSKPKQKFREQVIEKPRKNKGKGNPKKSKYPNRDHYQDWIVLKEEQRKQYGQRTASPKGREIIGRKVQYGK